MEVRVRNVDPSIVGVIDEYARSNNETRSDYLKRLLEYDARRNILEQASRNEEEKIKILSEILEVIMNNIRELGVEIQKVTALIAYLSDIDHQEVEYYLQNVVIEKETHQ